MATLSIGSGRRKAVGEKRLPPKFIARPGTWLPDLRPRFCLGLRETPFLIVYFCHSWAVEKASPSFKASDFSVHSQAPCYSLVSRVLLPQ